MMITAASVSPSTAAMTTASTAAKDGAFGRMVTALGSTLVSAFSSLSESLIKRAGTTNSVATGGLDARRRALGAKASLLPKMCGECRGRMARALVKPTGTLCVCSACELLLRSSATERAAPASPPASPPLRSKRKHVDEDLIDVCRNSSDEEEPQKRPRRSASPALSDPNEKVDGGERIISVPSYRHSVPRINLKGGDSAFCEELSDALLLARHAKYEAAEKKSRLLRPSVLSALHCTNGRQRSKSC